MKHLLLFCLLLSSAGLKAQSVKSTEINSADMVKFVGSMIQFHPIKGKQFYLNVLTVATASGTAQLAESHEISHDIWISISKYDEKAENKLFKLGPFINPKISKHVDNGRSILIEVSSYDGTSKRDKSFKIKVSEKEVRVE